EIVNAATLQVQSFQPTATGFTVTFNKLLNASQLNLYDSFPVSFGTPDLTLTDENGIVMRGSLLKSTVGGDTQITFVLTGQTSVGNDPSTHGTLPTGSYTLVLRSASNAFVDTSGNLLSGAATPGSNYTTTFSVIQPTLEFSLPDFTRGAGQTVNLPNDSGTGIPFRLYNSGSTAETISTLTFRMPYNISLLTITGIVRGSNVPTNAIGSLNTTSSPGVALVGFTAGPTPVLVPASAGALNLLDLTASVPTSAPYDGAELLDLQNIALNGA